MSRAIAAALRIHLPITAKDIALVWCSARGWALRRQSADGAYRPSLECGESLNYMTGLLNDVFIKYYTYYKPDSRIPRAIQRSIDFLWSTEWLPANQSFKYVSANCDDDKPEATPDLNNFFTTSFSWYGQYAKDASYRDKADQIFAGGVVGTWLDGSKQFNEEYTQSYHYLAYRPF